MAQDMTGGCQCGRIRYTVAVEDDAAYPCHCRMCQRATGGVFAAWKEVARAAVRWDTQEPERFVSSPIARRGFCAACGTSLTYEADGFDEMDLAVGSFDEPFGLRPVKQMGVESRHAAWADMRALPGTRTDEIPGIAKLWKEKGGNFPD